MTHFSERNICDTVFVAESVMKPVPVGKSVMQDFFQMCRCNNACAQEVNCAWLGVPAGVVQDQGSWVADPLLAKLLLRASFRSYPSQAEIEIGDFEGHRNPAAE